VCFVFGHEVEGVSEEILGLCDRKVFVPMYGKKESLNVEAAFSTVVYEAVRKFNNSAHGED
jgi:tRNA G18 (ribose-2'-O)-methylase SpoU